MAQILRYMQTKWKENGFQISKSMIRNTCLSSICYDSFQASQKSCRASENHELLARHGKLVLKIILVSDMTYLLMVWKTSALSAQLKRACLCSSNIVMVMMSSKVNSGLKLTSAVLSFPSKNRIIKNILINRIIKNILINRIIKNILINRIIKNILINKIKKIYL